MSTQKKPQLACAPDPAYPIIFPVYASVKLDGIRVFMDGVTPKTRSLKPVPNRYLQAVLTDCELLRDNDFELIMGDPADPLCYNRTFRAVMSHDGEPAVTCYIFDLITEGTFEERLAKIKLLEEASTRVPLPFKVVYLNQTLIHSQEELNAFYEWATAAGYEGVITKSPKGLYKYGRSTPKQQVMLKLKPEEDSEAEILDVYEAMENTNETFINELGQTDRSTMAEGLVGKNMLGGFVVRDCKTGVEFHCAPGKLEHEERTVIWNARSSYIGKILKYRHFPVGVVEKPRHPRWIGWRDPSDMGE